MGKADGHLEGAGSYADLRPHGNVPGSGLVVEVRQAAVAVAEVDVHVRAAEVANCRVREGTRQGVVAAQHNGCSASDVLCSIKKFTVEESQDLLTDADVTACVVNTNGDAVNGNTGDNLRVSATFTYKFSVGGGEVLTAFGAGVPSIDMTPTADLRLEKTISGISTC